MKILRRYLRGEDSQMQDLGYCDNCEKSYEKNKKEPDDFYPFFSFFLVLFSLQLYECLVNV